MKNRGRSPASSQNTSHKETIEYSSGRSYAESANSGDQNSNDLVLSQKVRRIDKMELGAPSFYRI